MHDEQREKQLASSTHGQTTENSGFTTISQANGGNGIPSFKTSNPPSPIKVDPFSHHMPPFTIYDKVMASIFIV